MKTSAQFLLILATACSLGFALPAQAADPEPPHDTHQADKAEEPDTVILSDTLHYDDVKKTSTFTGNVILTRGNMTLHAEKLVTHEDAQGNQHGTATTDPGKLVTIRQENPKKFETLVGTGQRAEYDGKSGDVTLIGQATVIRQVCGQTFDNIRGARVVYHDKSGTYEAFGGKDSAAAGGRVRSMAQPQSRVDQAIAKCRAGRS